MKSTSLLLVFFFSTLFSYSQDQATIDSLISQLEKLEQDSSKVNLLNEISLFVVKTDFDQAIKYSEDALNLSEEIKYKFGIGKSADLIGTIYKDKCDYDKAIKYGLKSLKIFKELNNKQAFAGSYTNLGVCYYRMGNYDEAEKHHLLGIKTFKEIGDKKGQVKAYVNLGLVYEKQRKDVKAIELYLEAFKLSEEIGYKAGIESAGNNMGIIYFNRKEYKKALTYYKKALEISIETNNMLGVEIKKGNIGNAYEYLNKIDTALIYYTEALDLALELGDKYGIALMNENIGNIYQKQEKYDLSVESYDKAISVYKEIGGNVNLAYAYYNKSRVLMLANNYTKSILFSEKAIEIALENKVMDVVSFSYGNLAENYYLLKDYKQAFDFLNKKYEIEDTLRTQQNSEIIAEMQTKYETAKKDAENSRLANENELQELKLHAEKQNKQNLIWLFCIGGLFIILLFLLIFIRFRFKKKTEMERRIAEQKNLGFKAVIEAEEKERIRIAKDLHDGIGQLLSSARVNIAALEGDVAKEDEALLKNSLDIIDESVREVRNISHNMMPVALIEYGLIKAVDTLVSRINEANVLVIDFKHKGVEDRIEQSTEISLYRIIQEVLNNMLKHSQAAKIVIDLRKSGHKILLKIQDDGKGFNLADIDKSSGIGWKNIYSRLLMINGNIDIKSNPGMGTVVNIDFNI
ncbi:MAG: tetratricopeptide repeat protein [Bacteroidota bacterium]